MILQSGFNVIVDAAFLKRQERQQFQTLAEELGLPFVVLNIRCDEETLRRRIHQRHAEGCDASEADVSVYEKLKAIAESLTVEECLSAIDICNDGEVDQWANASGIWRNLQRLTGQSVSS